MNFSRTIVSLFFLIEGSILKGKRDHWQVFVDNCDVARIVMNIDAASYITRRIINTISGDNGAMDVDIVGASPSEVDRASTNDEASVRKSSMKGNISVDQKDAGAS